MRWLAASALLLAVSGCAGVPLSDPEAEAAFATLESVLLEAPVLRIDYTITADGAISAKLEGDLVTQKPALAAMRAEGAFGAADVALKLVADGEQMRGGGGQQVFEHPAPEALHEGLLLGLLRMGVLHNLAMLTGGAPPDATDGSVRDWVVPGAFQWIEPDDTEQGTVRGIAFDLTVGGSPAGEVRLWYDSERNLPLRREQTVHFDSGDMQVTERYEIETGGIIGPCRFSIDTAGDGDS